LSSWALLAKRYRESRNRKAISGEPARWRPSGSPQPEQKQPADLAGGTIIARRQPFRQVAEGDGRGADRGGLPKRLTISHDSQRPDR
jgi:hypothetical protein